MTSATDCRIHTQTSALRMCLCMLHAATCMKIISSFYPFIHVSRIFFLPHFDADVFLLRKKFKSNCNANFEHCVIFNLLVKAIVVVGCQIKKGISDLFAKLKKIKYFCE